MLSKTTLLVVSCAALAATPAAARTNRLEAEANFRLQLAHSEIVQLEVQGELGEAITAGVEIAGRWYVMELEQRSVRSDRFEVLAQRPDGSWVSVDPGPVRTLAGYLQDAPGSRVAASLLDDGLYARISTGVDGEDDYWLEPLARHIPRAGATDHVLYSSADVLDHYGVCGADLLAENQNHVPFSGPGVGPGGNGSFAGVSLYVAELACDADFDYFQDWGSVPGVQNRIETVINAMNDQYIEDVEIRHDITTILVRTTPGAPYTSTDAGTLLNQFRNEWQANQGGIVRDVAHLFTGKNIDGGTIGIAWLSAVCGGFGYGLVQSDFSGSFSCATDLSAHELGHNWGADHCSCTSYTMNPFITCANDFSPTDSRPEIIAFRDSRNCLDIEDQGPPGTTLFFDDFESGGFTAGGWVLADSRPRVIESSSRNGVYGAKVKNTTWAERAVSTVGFDSVEVKYWRRTKDLDSGEQLFVEWWDGGTWNLIESTSSTAWAHPSFDLPVGAANNPNFKLRFRSNANEGKEKGDFDDVEVIGHGDPPPQTTLFSDDFESGGFGAGGWTLANSRPRVIESSARNGVYGAKVKNTTWAERAIDTTGFATIELNYWRRTRNMDSGEQLFVEWWDGSAWMLVEATSATSWSNQSFVLPAAAGNNASFKIRLRSNADQANEKGDFDDVEVLGS